MKLFKVCFSKQEALIVVNDYGEAMLSAAHRVGVKFETSPGSPHTIEGFLELANDHERVDWLCQMMVDDDRPGQARDWVTIRGVNPLERLFHYQIDRNPERVRSAEWVREWMLAICRGEA